MNSYRIVTISKIDKSIKEHSLKFTFTALLMYDEKVKTKLYHVNLYQGQTLIKSNFVQL